MLLPRPTAVLFGLSIFAQQTSCRRSLGAGRVVPDEIWDAAIAKPNATGTYPVVDIPDVSKSWPGEGESQNWTASISVRTDIPYEGDMLSGTGITIRAPDSLIGDNENSTWKVVKADEKWNACTYFYTWKDGGAFHDGESIDSTCQSVMPPNCASDLKEFASSQVLSDIDNGTLKCPWFDLPESCNGFKVNRGIYTGLFKVGDFNGSETLSLVSAGNGGENKDYNVSIDAGWAVLSVWTYNDTNVTAGLGSDDDLPTSLTCLRPSRLTQGSRLPANSATVFKVAMSAWVSMAMVFIWML